LPKILLIRATVNVAESFLPVHTSFENLTPSMKNTQKRENQFALNTFMRTFSKTDERCGNICVLYWIRKDVGNTL